MFCSKCGNQVDDNVQFCSKCGAPIGQQTGGMQEQAFSANDGNAGQNQNTNQYQNNNQYQNVNQNMNQYPNQYQQLAGNSSGYTRGFGADPADNRFRLLPAFFPWIAACVAGVYDLGIVLFLVGLIGLIPVVGWTILFVVGVLSFVFMGRNYNYLKRVHNETNMLFYQIIQDEKLKHF